MTATESVTIPRTTYRDMVRAYAHNVSEGRSDTDLSPRARRLTAVLLHTAANHDATAREYGRVDDADRERFVRILTDRMWDANTQAIADVFGPSAGDAYSAAMVRAVAILRGI